MTTPAAPAAPAAPDTTTPAATAPAAPAAPSTEATPPAPPAGTTPPEAAPQANTVEQLPDWAQKIVRDARQDAADARVRAKTAADDLTKQIGKALGLVTDEEPADPNKLTEQLTASQAAAQQAQLELAVFRNAGAAGADAQALIDSRTFLEKVKGIDASDTTALTAAISEAITTNPRFKATPGAAPVGSADISGGSAPARTYTRAQIADPTFFAANRADILRAHSEGRIRE